MERWTSMDAGMFRNRAYLLVAGVGVVLLLVAVGHHADEFLGPSGTSGPLLAFAFDAGLALCLMYAGYWLDRTDLSPEHRWTVAVWTCTGLALFVVAIAITMGIRVSEGRMVSEPVFTLLVVASTGGIAGFVAGYYRARALVDTRRAEQATGALAFVNGIIRHDLRNDMQVIRTNADLLADADDEEVRNRASTIAEKTTIATDRIDSTGAIMKTVTGDADFERVDLVDIARDSVDRLTSTYEVTVMTDLPDCAPVRANVAVESIVDNLLENAVEHNDGTDPEVAITIEPREQTIRLVVSDNGPGLPDTVVDSAFDGNHSSPGGLQIVHTLVDQFGGRVHTVNDSSGATIEVVLPRAT